MHNNQGSDFGKMCRALRIEKGLKQRQLMPVIGVALSTVGALETSRWKVISRDRAEKLATFYNLDADRTSSFLEAWDAAPLSPHGEKRHEYWKKRNALKSKAKNHDALKISLVRLLGLHLMSVPDDQVCACDFGAPLCDVCRALERVGIEPFTPADRDKILARLVAIQESMASAGAKPPTASA